MDPENSYLFCGRDLYPPANVSNGKTSRVSEEGCWHLTFATTRPLKLLYFDGNSAAKLSDGPLDSQDFLTWGKRRYGAERKGEDRQTLRVGKEFQLGWLCSVSTSSYSSFSP